MKPKPTRENTNIVILPLGPEGANDPTLMESFPEHARLIGLLVAEWCQIEYKIVALVAIALKVSFPTIADMVYSLESSGARMNVMRAALAHLRAEPAISEANALFAEADSLRQQRNKFAHGLYGEGPNGELVMFGVRKDTIAEVPLHDLIHQYGRMKSLSYRAGRLVSTLTGTFQGISSQTPADFSSSSDADSGSTERGFPPPQSQPSAE